MTDNAALFELTRLQILNMQAQRKCFPDAYAHAWNTRIFPVLLEQPRDRALEGDRSWHMTAPNMIRLQEQLMTLPGYHRPLDINDFAAVALRRNDHSMADACDLLRDVGRSGGGFKAVIAGCRYYRMQGYGTPGFWTALARSHHDLEDVDRDCLGIGEFDY